jgi:hypothetical protein
MKIDCSTCAFYYRPADSAGDIAACRRYPPVPIMINNEYRAKVPRYTLPYWCGEYIHKDKLNEIFPDL